MYVTRRGAYRRRAFGVTRIPSQSEKGDPMRYSIEDIAAGVGLSVPQTRRRIHAIEREFADEVTRGDHRKVFLTERGFTILRRAVEIEHSDGIAPNDAVRMVSEETGNADGAGVKTGVTSSHSDVTRELIEVLRARIADIEEERNHWRELAIKLQDQMPIALPAKTGERPDHRPWWARFLRLATE
jgi:hypothetical protein